MYPGIRMVTDFMLRYRVPVHVFALALIAVACRPASESLDDRVRYVTTLPVFASILGPIVGDVGSVHILLDDARSPHDYLPRPSDVRQIAAARVLVLGHPELDGWAESFGATDFFYLSDLVESEDLPRRTGLETTHTFENPHFWLDPVIVSLLVGHVAARLCGSVEEECREFQDNATAFAGRMDSLAATIGELISPLKGKYFVTVEPFFDFYFRRFGLNTAGTLQPFHGRRPTPASVVAVLKTEPLEKALAIVTEMNRSDELAKMFAAESGLPIIYLDPLGKPGDTYTRLMLKNTRALSELGLVAR